jgi:hypothetical protein
MATPFIIPESAYEGFEALIAIGEEKFTLLAGYVQNKRLTLDSEYLLSDLANATGAPKDALGRAIDNILIPLSGLRGDLRMAAAEFVDLLTELIEEQKGDWYEDHREAWGRVSPSLALLIGPDSYFAQLNKAYRLVVNRPAIVETARVLTELRPVYNDDVTHVKAYLITSTLAVSYQEFGDQKRIHLTVDKQDLERLREQVDRALRKIELLEKQVALLEVPSLVAGDGRG